MRARIDDLGTQGFVSDIAGYKLPNAAWTNVRNIAFADAAVQRFQGYTQFGPDLTFVPISLFGATTPSGDIIIAAGETEVWAAFEGSFVDISGASAPYGANQDLGWNGGNLSVLPVLNNGADPPQVWLNPDTGTTLEDLPNFPTNASCRVMRPFKSFLVGYDWTIDGERLPQLVKWSDIADPGTVPGSWDEGDPTTSAGQTDLGDSADYVVDALQLRDINIIYKERSVWGMQFIGGQFIFRFYRISGQHGLLAPNCVVDTPRGHVALTSSDLVLNDGQSIRSIADQRVWRWLFNNIDPTFFARTFLTTDPLNSEVWVVFPALNEEKPSIALVWNWLDDTFSTRDADGFRSGALTQLEEPEEAEAWEDDNAAWETDSSPWVRGAISEVTTRVVFAQDFDGNQRLMLGGTGNEIIEPNRPAFVERVALPLPAAPQGPVDYERFKFVQEIWPKLREGSNPATLNVYIGTQVEASQGVQWHGPYTFNPATQQKVNVRHSGRIISLRFESQSDVFWQLDGYDIVYRVRGRY